MAQNQALLAFLRSSEQDFQRGLRTMSPKQRAEAIAARRAVLTNNRYRRKDRKQRDNA